MKKSVAPSTVKRAVKTRHDINVVGNAARDARPPFRGATDTEVRDHMDSNKPVLFIPTEALGVVSDALKKWEAQQIEAKQPPTLLPSKDMAGQVCGLTRPKPLLPSMIDRAHDRVSTLRDKLQMLHERMGSVLRPCGPSTVNQCSTTEDVSSMPEAVQGIYAVGSRLNDVIDHVNDLLDRLEA